MVAQHEARLARIAGDCRLVRQREPMGPSRLVICLLFAAAPASGQELDLCAVHGPRTIRGGVVDSVGEPVNVGTVTLTRRLETDGRLALQHCTTPIRPDGSFEFTGIVSESLSLRAWTLWPTRGQAQIPAGVEPAVVNVTLTTPPQRVRDFADFDARPIPLQAPSGIPGCYWLGHTWGASRVVELRSDHRVGWLGAGSKPFQRWEERGQDSVRVYTFESPLWGWAGFSMDLSSPVDWSAIPALFESKTDGIERPDEWESFVTRVPCAGSP